jgi:hypothetical protein
VPDNGHTKALLSEIHSLIINWNFHKVAKGFHMIQKDSAVAENCYTLEALPHELETYNSPNCCTVE